MTREEAMLYLKADLIYDYMANTVNHKEHDEALKLAIQALSQKPTVTSTDEPMTMVYPTIVCDDAISREAAIKHLTKARMLGDSRPMTDIFAELPSVTQKSGKWIETEYHRWRCSVCREKGMSEWDNIHDVRTNFCPDCGAKMESEDKE